MKKYTVKPEMTEKLFNKFFKLLKYLKLRQHYLEIEQLVNDLPNQKSQLYHINNQLKFLVEGRFPKIMTKDVKQFVDYHTKLLPTNNQHWETYKFVIDDKNFNFIDFVEYVVNKYNEEYEV